MRLSKIKTKEIRYVVWKYRLKRFLPHILTLCLAVIVAGGAFSAYSVYHKKHQKQLAKQSEVQREKDVNTARKKAQKEKTTLKPWYTYHSIAHAMGGLDGKDYLNSIDVILSILVDTFISKISLTMQPGPKIDSISGA
jgi:glycerophosphoryl diester phosphodiesterase